MACPMMARCSGRLLQPFGNWMTWPTKSLTVVSPISSRKVVFSLCKVEKHAMMGVRVTKTLKKRLMTTRSLTSAYQPLTCVDQYWRACHPLSDPEPVGLGSIHRRLKSKPNDVHMRAQMHCTTTAHSEGRQCGTQGKLHCMPMVWMSRLV